MHTGPPLGCPVRCPPVQVPHLSPESEAQTLTKPGEVRLGPRSYPRSSSLCSHCSLPPGLCPQRLQAPPPLSPCLLPLRLSRHPLRDIRLSVPSAWNPPPQPCTPAALVPTATHLGSPDRPSEVPQGDNMGPFFTALILLLDHISSVTHLSPTPPGDREQSRTGP
jgi:hypothetical protein